MPPVPVDSIPTPPRGITESVANSVLDAAAPLALVSTGWGAVLAPLAPKIIDFVFAEYDAIRAQKPPTVTHEEIVAELKSRALTVDVAARLAAAESAAGVQ